MNSGIYCKLKSSGKVYNSILIDEYNKCISEACNSKTGNLEYSNSDMDNSSDSSSVTTELSDNNKWKCGMNVRARYSEDGEYYEAIIEKILDNKYASVRFLAYGNDETVKLKYLKPSHGEKAIEEQCEAAERNKEDNVYESDECDDSWKEVDWKVGMACRAMYNGNNTIYEATVQKVNSNNRTAVLIMTGFGKTFEAKFEDMYESIPEYREKQKIIAEKLKATSKCDVPIVSTFLNSATDTTLESKITKNETKDTNLGSSSATIHMNNAKVPINSCNDCSHSNDSKSQPGLNILPPSINNASVFSQCQGMMQPQTDSDALACLISSNYLSGYYAGFYDCMRKFQNQNKS